MEIRAALCIIGAASAFASASLLAAWVTESFRRARLRASVDSSAPAGEAILSKALRNGIPAFLGMARAACCVRSVNALLEGACRVLRGRGLVTSCVHLGSVVLAGLVLAAVAGGVVSASLLGGLACLAAAAAGFALWVQAANEKRDAALRDSVPDALKAMASCSQTGLSLEQMLQQVSHELKGDLGALIQGSANVLKTGGTASQALDQLRDGSDVAELSFAAVALDVQHQTGGSLQKILRAAQETVQAELDLQRQLHVQTAQAKLSARIVTLMPFVLMALLSVISSDFLAPFFETPAGLALLIVALAMQLAGVLTVRGMLRVGD